MYKSGYLSTFIAAVMAATLLTACGDDDQEHYEDATEALEEAKEHRAEAKEQLQEKEKELQRMREKMEKSEKHLAEAREELSEAEAKVNASVNDEVLFRTIQRKLLDSEKFGDSAIAVGVADRVVTLTGTVPDAKTRKMALETAGKQSGVKEVVDFLEIQGASPKKPQANKKSE